MFLKHKNTIQTPTFVCCNIRTLLLNIFIELHFSLSLNWQLRHFISHCPKLCKKCYRIGPFETSLVIPVLQSNMLDMINAQKSMPFLPDSEVPKSK